MLAVLRALTSKSLMRISSSSSLLDYQTRILLSSSLSMESNLKSLRSILLSLAYSTMKLARLVTRMKVVLQSTAMHAERVNKFGGNVQCFYCLEMGHYSSSCPVKLKDNKAREDAGRQRLKEALAVLRLDSDDESDNYAM